MWLQVTSQTWGSYRASFARGLSSTGELSVLLKHGVSLAQRFQDFCIAFIWENGVSKAEGLLFFMLEM